jgi:hypothetical protein
MTLTVPEARATHFRLKDETWAIIGEEYRKGATAKELAVKWMVSPTSVYRHACEDGWTKKACGDERARANAREVEAREEEAREAARKPAGPEAQRDRKVDLFVDLEMEPAAPAELAQQATWASGRAMREGRWNEARALAGLAESYMRLAERKVSGELTPETVPLGLLLAIAYGPEARWRSRMSLIGARDGDPETAVKRQFWERKEARKAGEESRMLARYTEGLLEGRRAEARVREESGGG